MAGRFPLKPLALRRGVTAFLCATWIATAHPVVSSGQESRDGAKVEASSTVEESLGQARSFLRDGDYDRSIEVLKAALEEARRQVSAADPTEPSGTTPSDTAWQGLRDVYLLLAKTYVFLGNDLKFKPQGREASNLNYQEARRLIGEALGTHELRHTQPDPALDPPEMIAFFDEARRQMFGAFRVLEIEPADAIVLLDGDTLRAAANETQVGDVDIAVGPHEVTVHAPGFKEIVDAITISPDVTLERSYFLSKRRGWLWYATRGVGALGIVGGVVAAVAGGGGGSSAAVLEPLPEAPGPPGSSQQ